MGGNQRDGRRAERGPLAGVPTLREERRLLRSGHVLVAGMDEVGRGALAGPVTVGVVVVDLAVGTVPRACAIPSSSCRQPARRSSRGCAGGRRAWAVGHAEPEEIDAHGIIAALRLAGRRALAQLPALPECVLLDGNHNWLTRARPRRRPRRGRALPGRAGRSARGAAAGPRSPRPPGRRTRRTHDDQSGPAVRCGGGRQRARQGRTRRDHGRSGPGLPRLRVGGEQGLLRSRAR